VHATIRAARPWNDTGIVLEAGAAYALAAEGDWTDFFIRSGPEGNPAPTWTQRLLLSRLRMPGERYFALIGAIDRDPATQFLIGRGLARWIASRSGQLTCFANDVPGFYWNNRGAVKLTVTRLAGDRG
jgi:hypothetical protein